MFLCNTAWRYLKVLKKAVSTVHAVKSVISLNRTVTETEKALHINIDFLHEENGQRNAETEEKSISKSH